MIYSTLTILLVGLLSFILGMTFYHQRRKYIMDLYISLMAFKFGNIRGFIRSFFNYAFRK